MNGSVEPRRRVIALDSPAGGGEVAALEFGPAGRALDILFLHANGFNAFTYRRILGALAGDFRILALDMRGHGRTTLPTPVDGHAWRVYADDALAVLAALGEMPRVLAGHSMGGATCLLMAPRIGAAHRMNLVLFDPVLAQPEVYPLSGTAPPSWDQPMAQGALRRKNAFASREEALTAYRGRGAFKTWPDGILADYLADGLRQQADGSFVLCCAPQWEAANFACYGISNPYGALAGAGGVVRVLKAEQGSVCFFGPARGDFAEGAVRLEVVPDTTHFLPMERPDLVQSALRNGCSHS